LSLAHPTSALTGSPGAGFLAYCSRSKPVPDQSARAGRRLVPHCDRFETPVFRRIVMTIIPERGARFF
jgi:hypothetical protein